jgi:hypothetical protein
MPRATPRLDLHPSSADRWTTCTASPGFIFDNSDKLAEDTATAFSNEGTSAHEVAVAYLQNREPNPASCPVPVDADMRLHAWNYSQYVEDLIAQGGMLAVEQKMPLWYAKGRNCYVDAAVINPSHLHIIDLKYGEGVPVHPENNLQATIYAMSVVTTRDMRLHEDHPISIHIYQPRGRSSQESPAHVWHTTWGAINEASVKITETAERILGRLKGDTSIKLEFAPSEKACRFCPARGFCDARRESFAAEFQPIATLDEKPPTLPSPGTLSVEQIAAVLRHGEDVKKWIGDVSAYALQHMQTGGSVPGFKVVTSRGGNRRWADPKLAAKLLVQDTILKRAEVVEEVVISPAEAEKMIGKNKFSAELTNLIVKPPGKPCIATDDDPREAIGSALNEFSDITEDLSFLE